MYCFGDKISLSAFFIDWKCRWLQSGPADLEKHQTLAFFAYGRFLRIFKITHFKRFLKDFFLNHQKHMLNWLNAFYFM